MPPRMLQIGVTGGIGSGKSLVCQIFKHLGIPVYDADYWARWLLSNNSALITAVKETFGEHAYDQQNQIDRQFMAEQVFNQSEQLNKLNQLVHPLVGLDYQKWVGQYDALYVIKEAALLIESGGYKSLDKLITIYAPENMRIKRVAQRDPHRSLDQIKAIISNQTTEENRQELADYVIKNDENELVIPQVLLLHQMFLKM
ncbi:MAG: dephospho-CoA kinase [Bacteroidetes bacterium]|nr:dephospho-CoA kinase [Bacteroidota bacterium]